MHYLNDLSVLAADPGYGWAHGGGWWPWGLAFFSFWILLIAVVAVAVGLIIRRGARPPGATAEASGVERARAILAERFARGEISVEEYDERLTHLS